MKQARKKNILLYHLRAQDGRCYYCSAELSTDTATLDHVVPLCAGGKSTRTNFVAACRPCNEDKDALPLEHYLKIAKERRA